MPSVSIKILKPSRVRDVGLVALVIALAAGLPSLRSSAAEPSQDAGAAAQTLQLDTPKLLTDYFEQMSRAKPLVVRAGDEWQTHRRQLREFVLQCTGLWPLPERVPLDVHESAPLDHPWCTVRRVYYQLWPGVYSSGLLFLPKQFPERPAPAMLCPHGHWENGNAHPEVQKRCLNFARLGYVTFSTSQNHYEDPTLGVSHQTLMVWNNIRGLDYLESLPDVDRTRIGVAGASGGGLQTQMLTAVDPRVKAATIVGLTCDFRQIMFPGATHCACNHFPNVMRRTDHPEISTLGLPAAVQYLTMNDWTKGFEADNFPMIQKLYAANDCGERVFCKYFNTAHSYDRTKREYTYWWMDRWLRNQISESPAAEPETQTFPVETILKLSADVSGNKGFPEISRIYRSARGYQKPELTSADDVWAYRKRLTDSLRDLLGEDAILPRQATMVAGEARTEDDLAVQRVAYPSEAKLVVPTVLLMPATRFGKLPITIVLSGDGKEALLAQTGSHSPRELVRQGNLVVLPDVRTYGELFSTGGQNAAGQRQAWERNGIVWGRPVLGLAATDLRAVLDGLVARPEADGSRVTVLVRGSGDLSIAALFAMALDARIKAADLDFSGACFENRKLPLVSCVLQHGDVLQWAAAVADRRLTLRGIPPEAGDVAWLQRAFAATGNADGLTLP